MFFSTRWRDRLNVYLFWCLFSKLVLNTRNAYVLIVRTSFGCASVPITRRNIDTYWILSTKICLTILKTCWNRVYEIYKYVRIYTRDFFFFQTLVFFLRFVELFMVLMLSNSPQNIVTCLGRPFSSPMTNRSAVFGLIGLLLRGGTRGFGGCFIVVLRARTRRVLSPDGR